MAVINGVNQANAVGKTLQQFLFEQGYENKFLAVEKNGTIVPKSQYEITIILQDDWIEIVNFVGGG